VDRDSVSLAALQHFWYSCEFELARRRSAPLPMCMVDDPTLALITRFVGENSRLDPSEPEFLREQVAAVAAYVQRFPEHERNARALEWIGLNAERYRREWQKRTALEVLSRARCPDCPITGGDEHTPCAIHARWLSLLRRYAADELSSPEYVEQTLALLRANKDLLKVGRRHAHVLDPHPPELSAR
jgi:hypothetical protein